MTTKTAATAKAKTVRILGQEVREGTKKHAALLAQVRHFNDLAKYEVATPSR